MLAQYATPLDFLYLTLTVCIALLTLFLVMALFHFVGILSNARKLSATLKDTASLINHYLWQPLKFAMSIIEKTKEHASKAARKAAKRAGD